MKHLQQNPPKSSVNPNSKYPKFPQTLAPNPKTECPLCAEHFDSSQLMSICSCSHQFCRKCCLEYARVAIKAFRPVTCPQGCGAEIYLEGGMGMILSDDEKQAYKKAQFIRQTDRQNLTRCPNSGCSDGILISHAGLEQNVMECYSCLKRYCSKCWWPQHRGDCNGAADSFIQNQLLFAVCPGCSKKIERNQGCNHMTCTCKFQFCYLCLAKWSLDHVCLNNSRIQRFGHHREQRNRGGRERVEPDVDVGLMARQAQERIQMEWRNQLRLIQQQRRRDQEIQRQKLIFYEEQRRKFQQNLREYNAMKIINSKQNHEHKSISKPSSVTPNFMQLKQNKFSSNTNQLRSYNPQYFETPQTNSKRNQINRSAKDIPAISYTSKIGRQQMLNIEEDGKEQKKQFLKYFYLIKSEQDAINRIKYPQEQQQRRKEVRMEKLRERANEQRLNQVLQMKDQEMRQKKKNQRIFKNNQRFFSSQIVL